MDIVFFNNYYKYFQWNKGLLDHYFSTRNDEIRLYVDSRLLEEVGRKAQIEAEDYVSDFILSVEKFCANYNLYICPKRDPNRDRVCSHLDCRYRTGNSCLKLDRRRDVLLIARHIYTSEIRYYDKYETADSQIKIRLDKDKPIVHSLPFFALVIYTIFKFDNGDTQKWDNVGDDIAPSSRAYIKGIWQKISEFDSRFDPNASVYDRSQSEYDDYAGRILYHLPLSATTRRKLQDAIYKSSSWKLIGTSSSWEIIASLIHTLKDIKANEELHNILLKCYSTEDYHGISIRRVQSVIDGFDIDEYEARLAERRRVSDYDQTIISGVFALGIFLPPDSDEDTSVVLLTTVQQPIDEGGFCIEAGHSGTLAGYNTSFVSFKGSLQACIKEYSLRNSNFSIIPLPCEDVVFFYKYDDNLYIQTREIIPAKAYIIAVRNNATSSFELWCNSNHNQILQLPLDDTRELFGAEWIIYYTDNKLSGQYYDKKTVRNESTFAVNNGGIKKEGSNVYFINALPSFEVPEVYDINKVAVYLNLNSRLFEDYKIIRTDGRIMIDILGMPINSDEEADIDICLRYGSQTIFPSECIKVCGQPIRYNSESFYKYDNFGVIINTDSSSYSISGNHIKKEYRSNQVRGLFIVSRRKFVSFTDDLLFTNLLAACCYASPTTEVSHYYFRKCVNYAATRLGIDTQSNDFTGRLKKALAYAGIISIDYANNRCQAIAPSFMRVPFSVHQSDGTQLIMLCGCYTRSFIADLATYCDSRGINIYTVDNNKLTDIDKFLPPIILIDHCFNPNDFCSEYHHGCDVLLDYDFALSLLNFFPDYRAIRSKFIFRENHSPHFLSLLKASRSDAMPRLRSIPSGQKSKWFIESEGNMFADVQNGYESWASLYCHRESETPMVLLNRNNTVLLPDSLFLPNYVLRALYIMNLGLPKKKKVFVCNGKENGYYTLMKEYYLGNRVRCETLAAKISGASVDETPHARTTIQTGYKLEFWSEIGVKKHIERYLILYGSTEKILAIAYEHKVYLKWNNTYYRIDSDKMNSILSFLITERWQFETGYGAIGVSINSGDGFKKVFSITNSSISEPSRERFHIENINIV
jgi:hypothetical protein